MKRLFTFGCSFTNYEWSTWADCLAPEFDFFENWGQQGQGNHYIFNSIIEADLRNKFRSGDTVVVCWTDVIREDRYLDGWKIIHVKNHISKFTERGCLIRDLAYIRAIKLLLESRPGVVWKFTSMVPLSNTDLWGNTIDDNNQDILALYQDVINCMLPSFQTVLRPLGWGGPYPGWEQKTRNNDSHPNPVEHLEYLDLVLPGWVTKQETRNSMLTETELLEKNKYKRENHMPKRSGSCTLKRL